MEEVNHTDSLAEVHIDQPADQSTAEKVEYDQIYPSVTSNDNDQPPMDEDENLPKSSIENIIPLQNLKRGWFTISAFVAQTASAATTKANEALNSEEFQAMKKRASDAVAPAWEKTVEVAAPIWEQTKNTVATAVEKTNETAAGALEKTKESLNVMAEQIRPTVETVSDQVKVAATEGWHKMSEVASTAAEYTTETVQKLTKEWSDVHGHSTGNAPTDEHATGSASAMDSATRGGPMTI